MERPATACIECGWRDDAEVGRFGELSPVASHRAAGRCAVIADSNLFYRRGEPLGPIPCPYCAWNATAHEPWSERGSIGTWFDAQRKELWASVRSHVVAAHPGAARLPDRPPSRRTATCLPGERLLGAVCEKCGWRTEPSDPAPEREVLNSWLSNVRRGMAAELQAHVATAHTSVVERASRAVGESVGASLSETRTGRSVGVVIVAAAIILAVLLALAVAQNFLSSGGYDPCSGPTTGDPVRCASP